MNTERSSSEGDMIYSLLLEHVGCDLRGKVFVSPGDIARDVKAR